MLLTETMNSWDVGRGRGGVEAALPAVTARAVVAGIDTDRLYPIAQQQQVAEALGCADPTSSATTSWSSGRDRHEFVALGVAG